MSAVGTSAIAQCVRLCVIGQSRDGFPTYPGFSASVWQCACDTTCSYNAGYENLWLTIVAGHRAVDTESKRIMNRWRSIKCNVSQEARWTHRDGFVYSRTQSVSHHCASVRHSDIKSSRKCMHVCCICAAAAIVCYETVRVELSNDGDCETCAGASR